MNLQELKGKKINELNAIARVSTSRGHPACASRI